MPVVIDNKPGANLFLAAQDVARASPDGHTLLLAHDSIFTVNPYAFAKLPYDPEKDFAPISLVSTAPLWIAASSKTNFRTMGQLIGFAKMHPGKINFGSGALVARLGGEYLRSLTGAAMTYIPYKGSAPAIQALLGGEIDVVISDPTPFVPLISDPRISILGHTGNGRVAIAPQIPSLEEQGIKDFVVLDWFALYAPNFTSPLVVDRLTAELAQFEKRPEIKTSFEKMGLELRVSTALELEKRKNSDSRRWAQVIRDAGIKLDG
jgi:tripartite-type tricarboxylate transporter receptor subunit TctC